MSLAEDDHREAMTGKVPISDAAGEVHAHHLLGGTSEYGKDTFLARLRRGCGRGKARAGVNY